MLERLKQENKITGVKQTLKAAEEGRAEIVFVAADADKRVIAGLGLRNVSISPARTSDFRI